MVQGLVQAGCGEGFDLSCRAAKSSICEVSSGVATTPPAAVRSAGSRFSEWTVNAPAETPTTHNSAPVAIAKQAGVGVGTLYRHYPTREALIYAAYQHKLTRVCEMATDLATQHLATEATRMWLEHLLDYATAKSGMSEALNTVIASGG